MLIEEYKRSLKMPEVEEIFDLIFYRPLGFLFVTSIYRSPITPNHITILSMVTGLMAAWYFSIGVSTAILWGSLWYALANILDCSDGQLARLQKSGTLLGRIIDGMVDYISSIAIFLGLGLGLSATGTSMWWLVVAGGLSSALHAMFFDHYQSEFISTVRNQTNFLEREVQQFTDEIRKRELEQRNGIIIFIMKIYLWYLGLQKQSNTKKYMQQFNPESYLNENRMMIRCWSFLGPTTNRTMLIICALIGRVDIFLWIVVTLGNLWLLCCFILQRHIHRRLEMAEGYSRVVEQKFR